MNEEELFCKLFPEYAVNGKPLSPYFDLFEAGYEKAEEKVPIWHDLRKDPNDLPKESCSVLVAYEYDDKTYTDNYINDKEHNIICWETEYKDPYCSPRVIAWTEKPQFRE